MLIVAIYTGLCIAVSVAILAWLVVSYGWVGAVLGLAAAVGGLGAWLVNR